MGNKHDGRLSQGTRTGGMNEVVCAMGMLMRTSTGSINERWMYWGHECGVCNGHVDQGKYGEH